MNRIKGLAAMIGVGLLMTSFAPDAVADAWNKSTVLTVNEAIRVPRMTLPPGKYLVKLMNSTSNRHIVQIFNEDQTKLLTTILALPNYRLRPTEHTEFVFWEAPVGQPRALRAWFYPGDNMGQEFVYDKNDSPIAVADTQPARIPESMTGNHSSVSEASPKTAPEHPIRKSVVIIAQNQPRSATPAPAANTAAEPASSDAAGEPAKLPETASPYPLFGMIGLLALTGYTAIRQMRRA